MNPRLPIQIAHILILGPLLIAIGTGYIQPSYYVVALGAFIVVYHIYKMINRGSFYWVNVFHAAILGPLLIAYGLGSPRFVREFILMGGVAAIGYHGYYALST
jgi:hypothetical protein